MTNKEALAMQGVEFTYVFEDGDTMPAYVKKVDIKTGRMTAWSFSFVTEQGFEFTPSSDDERTEGAICVLIGRHWGETKRTLNEIRDTGERRGPSGPLGTFPGCIF